MGTVLSVVERFIEERGGVADRSDDRLETLVPRVLAEELDLPGHAVLTDGQDAGGGLVPVGHGTALLERILRTATGARHAASLALRSGSRVAGDPRKRLENDFELLNAVCDLLGSDGDREEDYWWFTYAFRVSADDRREGLVDAVVSSQGVASPTLLDQLELPLDWEEPADFARPDWRQRLERTASLAAQAATDRLASQMDEFIKGISRRHLRDVRRIRSYFGDLQQEMRAEIARRRLTGDALEVRKGKVARLADEEEGKVEALREKYAVMVELEPVALVHVKLPVVEYTVRVRRRRNERSFTLRIPFLGGRSDPFVCASCGAGAYKVGFCDAEVHPLCGDCFGRTQARGRRGCPRCAGEMPPASPEKVRLRWRLAGVPGRRAVETEAAPPRAVEVAGARIGATRDEGSPQRAVEAEGAPPPAARPLQTQFEFGTGTRERRPLAESGYTGSTRRLLEALTTSPDGIAPAALWSQAGVEPGEGRKVFRRLLADGQVRREGRGRGTRYYPGPRAPGK